MDWREEVEGREVGSERAARAGMEVRGCGALSVGGFW